MSQHSVRTEWPMVYVPTPRNTAGASPPIASPQMSPAVFSSHLGGNNRLKDVPQSLVMSRGVVGAQQGVLDVLRDILDLDVLNRQRF